MKLFHIALALLAAVPVQAHAQETQASVRVAYADLDLATPSGIKNLDRRLAWAIRSVCNELYGTSGMARRFATERCITEKSREMTAQRDRVVAAHAAPVALAAR